MKINQKDWIQFLLYAAVLVVINLVSSSLFFRWDLTQNKMYSLSDASARSVSTLEEPLTIRVFLSDNLPQPYNSLEQEVSDLMEEYSYKANNNFNYQIYIMDKDGEKTDSRGIPLTELAAQYGISPIDVQSYQNNEVSLISGYMGMVIVQGELSKQVNALGSQGNLEFQITQMIDVMAKKSSVLLSMDQPIEVKLIFSGALTQLDPSFRTYVDNVKTLVQDLQPPYYNQLAFQYIDPKMADSTELMEYKLNSYNLGVKGTDQQEPVLAALVVRRGDNFKKVELIQRSLFGDHVIDAKELEDSIKDMADSLLGIAPTVGFLSDHGAPALYDYSMFQQQPSQSRSLTKFNQLLSKNYQLTPVTLEDLPPGLNSLIIAGVTEPFTDWELFQLDQFLLRGGSLALFLDPFVEKAAQGQMALYGQPPSYIPLDTGLKKLLEFHGITLKSSYLMDQQCYVSQQQSPQGGVIQQKLFFAPQIQNQNILQDSSIMGNLKGLIMLNSAPLELDEEKLAGKDYQVLFSSSDKSWEMSDNISLVPQMIVAPPEDQMAQYPLSVLLQGEFTSYFADKEIPQAPLSEEEAEEDTLLLENSGTQVEILSQGTGGQLFVLGSSMVLGDNMLDDQGQSPNAMFVLNLVDSLNGRGDYAIMRSKGQMYNPIDADISSVKKTSIKLFNLIGLPVLVILAGVVLWLFWMRRKKAISAIFQGV
ncbi:MAG: GldG family protein [Spirochaetaceae bacterium]|jgi:ABC-2 type transport system permease protein|nr:GldG family protein [Spirochaetaceae bacterium]